MSDNDIDFDQQILDNIEISRNEIPHPSLPKGSDIYGSTKIFPDYTATRTSTTSSSCTASRTSRR